MRTQKKGLRPKSKIRFRQSNSRSLRWCEAPSFRRFLRLFFSARRGRAAKRPQPGVELLSYYRFLSWREAPVISIARRRRVFIPGRKAPSFRLEVPVTLTAAVPSSRRKALVTLSATGRFSFPGAKLLYNNSWNVYLIVGELFCRSVSLPVAGRFSFGRRAKRPWSGMKLLLYCPPQAGPLSSNV